MSGICGTTGVITSEAQLSVAFAGSVLPPIASGRITGGELKGRLTAQKLEDIYNTLVAQGDLVSNDSYKRELSRVADTQNVNQTAVQALLDTLGAKESTTMRKIQEEFCFNYFRYRYSLERLFDKLATTSKSTTLSDTDRTDIQNHLNKAREFNEKLNDLVQITNFIAQKRAQEMRQQNNEINQLNTSIASTYATLQNHNRLLNSQTNIQDLRKRMVEFTEEKNRSAVNLLSLFGFLNLVAIGLLFYISRS